MVHKMSTWWGLVILMTCKILHTLQSTCSDRPNIVCVPVGGRVSVPCPNPSANDVKFSLFKDGKDIHHHMCNGKNTSNSHPSTTVGVEYKEAEKNSFNFTLTGVNASSHGIYQCEGTILFPPPLKSLPSTPGILLLIEGHQCNNRMNKNPEVNQTSGSSWLWTFTVILSIYSFAVTISAIIIWVKWRKDVSQSDYVNTNPITTHRNRGKLHNPKPRFFYVSD